MYKLPQFSSYGNYSSGNYGAHALRFDFGPVSIWYSYSTAVAFHVDGHARVVHENDWGPTTGKHLNWIDGGDKRERVSSENFQKLWNEQVAPLFGANEEKPNHPLLKKIAGRISGIHDDDLTTAEGQIANLLLKAGYLDKDGTGNLVET